jgi:hypothetical protein
MLFHFFRKNAKEGRIQMRGREDETTNPWQLHLIPDADLEPEQLARSGINGQLIPGQVFS